MSIGQYSAYPQLGTKGLLASKNALAEKAGLKDMMEHDVVVRMPPKNRYFVEVDVTKISEAKPKIVAPDSS